MKKGVKQAFVVVLTLAMILSFSGCGSKTPATPTPTAADKEVTIRFNQGLPAKHFMSTEIKNWADAAMKNNSSLKIQIYDSAQLYKDADAIEAVQTGAIESAMAYDFNLSRIVPDMGMVTCPGLINSTDLAMKILATPSIMDNLNGQLLKQNLKVLAWLPWPCEEQGVTSKKPIHTLADIKGLSGRVNGPETGLLWQKWGMTPSFLSGSEIYMALQRDVIQTAHTSLASNIDRKYYEVAPYHTILPVGEVFTCLMINNDYFSKLSAAQQKALVDAGAAVQAKAGDAAKASNAADLVIAKDLKITVYTPTADELKAFTNGIDDVIAQAYKDRPSTLALIKQVQAMKTAK